MGEKSSSLLFLLSPLLLLLLLLVLVLVSVLFAFVGCCRCCCSTAKYDPTSSKWIVPKKVGAILTVFECLSEKTVVWNVSQQSSTLLNSLLLWSRAFSSPAVRGYEF